MPTLHRYVERNGYFVKGIMKGEPVAFRLSPEGEQYLTETLGLSDGARFGGDTLKWLYRKEWALLLDRMPEGTSGSVPVAAAPAPAAPSAAEARHAAAAVAEAPAPASVLLPEVNEVIFQGVIAVRLSALDQVLLDQAAADATRAIGRTRAVVLGPLPLPVVIDTYRVLRAPAPKSYEVRTYQRMLQVRNPRRQTIELMNNFSLPREVDVQVEMQPGAR